MDYLDYQKYTFCYFWSPCLEQIQIAGHFEGEDPDNPVVIEVAKNKDELYRLLRKNDTGRRGRLVVIICGIGCMGKTTLAIAVIQRRVFITHFFVIDLWKKLWRDELRDGDRLSRRLCKPHIMDKDSRESRRFHVQKRIPSQLFNRNLRLNDHYYTQAWEDILAAFGKASKPFYLFIHEAHSLTDFEMLLPLKYLSRLPMGSMILFTTTSLDEASMIQLQDNMKNAIYSLSIPSTCGFQLQDDIEVHSHRVNSLSEPQAKKLLWLYALSDQKQLSNRIVNTDALLQICEGIPAVLRIVGSQLRTKINAVSACNEILEYHRKFEERGLEGGPEHPGERMVDFAYGQLCEFSKESFLDIAFFFDDWERWKVAYIVGEMELHNLEEAALVTSEAEVELERWKMGVGERVKVDEIVRARGRKLSNGRNRIIDWESWFHLNQKLNKNIKGISVSDSKYIKAKKVDLTSTSLRVLSLGDGTRLDGRLKRAFTQLRFLHISYDDMLKMRRLRKSINLRVLIVRLTKKDEPDFTIKVPKSLWLQHLEVDVPESLRLLHLKVDAVDPRPLLHINGFLLEELRLSLGGFTSIPESLLNFSCLKILRLYWSELERLPDRFVENLSSLEILSMANCSKLESLPERFGMFSSLQRLDISHCSMLERLPDSFVNLSSLQSLNMSHCSMLKSLPDSFGNLSSMRLLDMSHCSMLERLPDSFVNLSSLQRLYMSHCSRLWSLPDSRGDLSLKYLDIAGCFMLGTVPGSFLAEGINYC